MTDLTEEVEGKYTYRQIAMMQMTLLQKVKRLPTKLREWQEQHSVELVASEDGWVAPNAEPATCFPSDIEADLDLIDQLTQKDRCVSIPRHKQTFPASQYPPCFLSSGR